VSADSVLPFGFEALPVRGALIYLSRSWRRMQRDHQYDALITETLGHAAAATALIAHSLKFEGAITTQIQGSSALQMLVVQCTNDLELRGMAAIKPGVIAKTFAELTANAHCAITIDEGDQPYQGIVSIDGKTLSSSLEHYFERSVQIPSHVALIANGNVAGGLLIQQVPGQTISDDDWNRLGFLAKTLAIKDFDGTTGVELIGKLFAEDDVRIHESKDVEFRCRCTDQKVEDVLKMIGEKESRSVLKERGIIEVVCEYCGERRSFDSVDVSKIFSDNVVSGPESIQ